MGRAEDDFGIEGGEHGWQSLVRSVGHATSHPQNAEDLLHSAYVRLLRYQEKFVVEKPSAFLLHTARNLFVDEVRKARVRKGSLSLSSISDVADEAPLQDEVMLAQEQLASLKKGLARLRPRTREIFLMHRIDGLKYREIAAHHGISVSAVEKHIAKAMQFLARWMDSF